MMETAKDLVQFSARDHLVLVWMDGWMVWMVLVLVLVHAGLDNAGAGLDGAGAGAGLDGCELELYTFADDHLMRR